MRNAFVKRLIELAERDKSLMLLTGDLGFKVLDQFRDLYPKQFLNIGVAEANMAGIAAGLALEGKRPFTYSIAPFATMRCYEQIRNDICFHKANVKIVSVGGGYSYGNNGPTHHALTDIAIMRVLPEMTVVCPGDPVEAAGATEAALNHEGPVYLRLGRSNEVVLHEKDLDFKIGKGIILREGKEIALISTGNMLEISLKAADVLCASGLSVRVVSLHTVKPLDEPLLKECLENFPAVFTIEEHSILGGLGSAVGEFMVSQDIKQAKLKCIAAPDYTIHEVGSHEYLRKICGLTSDQITYTIQSTIKEWQLC